MTEANDHWNELVESVQEYFGDETVIESDYGIGYKFKHTVGWKRAKDSGASPEKIDLAIFDTIWSICGFWDTGRDDWCENMGDVFLDLYVNPLN